MKRNGRPPFVPTEKDQKMVEAMAACGVPHDDIAKVVGLAAKALRKHFRDALDKASLRANAKVAATLFSMATSGENTAATLFWMKCRLGWKETSVVQHSGLEGKPIEVAYGTATERLASRIDSLSAGEAEASNPHRVNGI